MSVKTLRAQHAEATRAELIRVGRHLFASKGFADVSAEEIAREAGVTRGALYHHFKDKRDLFCEVCDIVSFELTTRVGEAGLAKAATDPWAAITEGVDAFLDACLEGDFQRIVILEAPAVVGWDEWRERAAGHELELMTTGLQLVMDAGIIAKQPPEMLAAMLLAVMNEGAMQIAKSPDPKATRRKVGKTIRSVFEALRTDRG
jgi:AcrR family transcriptional regulator